MGVGIAVGHWDQYIYIDSTINTGSIDVWPSIDGDLVFSPENHKDRMGDVATGTAIIDETYRSLNITLNRVYPCLWVNATLNLENRGTVPAGFKGMTCEATPDLVLVPITPPAGVSYAWEVWFDDTAEQNDPNLPVAFLYISNVRVEQIQLLSAVPDGANLLCQIDPYDAVLADFAIHFYEGLPQDSTITFLLTLEFWNWNEACYDYCAQYD